MSAARLLLLPLAAMLVLLPSCQRSSGGPLDPVTASEGVVRPDRSVVLESASLTARITGRWSSTGENTLRIRYGNTGRSPQSVAVTGLGMRHAIGDAVLRTAVDATGVDLSDARTDNDRPHVLFARENGTEAAAALVIPPGGSRDVDAELTSFSNDRSVEAGDRIVATIPMGDHSTAVTFVAGRP